MSDQVTEPVVEPVVSDGTDPNEVQVGTEAIPPEGTPDPTQGQPETQGQETPEDIEKARAFFQTKAQEEAEQRKALEAELEALNAQLDQVYSAQGQELEGQVPLPVSPQAPPAQPTQESVEYDPDDPIAPLMRRFDAMEQREQARERQRAINEQRQTALQTELQMANDVIREFQENKKLSSSVVQNTVRQATNFIPDDGKPGTSIRQAKLALQFMGQYLATQGVQAHEAQRIAADQAKVTQMGKTVQPIGVAPDTPAPGGAKSLNDQLADGIIPDDPIIQ